ncbi:entry exclusion lipoprotein TrbK [Stutzerimonas balearica]|uniref:EexN family lipoprotein n=1 Tax=Stutzerimonas balearica TaxID=74829 RepID=UPI00077436E2|nr:EexN family lipoprotein [Stutzerimonas balearica]OMG66308.1 entry exclusion lipoprotein TrbK [Stutzerimonas balearica]
MKKVMSFLCILALTACGQPETPVPSAVPSVDELAADPARLKELRQQCKLDRARLGDELCNRVAEATRKRFYGDGTVPYTPPKEPSKF